MHYVLDWVVLAIFVYVQWRITRLVLRSGAERWSGWKLSALRVAVVAGNLILVTGYVFRSPAVYTRVALPKRVDAYLEAFVLTYLLFMTGAVALRMTVRFVGRRWNAEAHPGRRRLLRLATQAAVAAPAAVLGYGMFIGRRDFRVREVDVPLAGLPRDLEGLRILLLSDIHRGPFLSDSELGWVVDASIDLRPNLAVVTGDLISAHGDPLDSCIAQLARLKADAGVFGCMGNHERYADALEYTERAAGRVGIPFLRGRAQALRFGGATLNLAGVDYQPRHEPYLAGAERLVAPDAVNVLLSHNPDVFPVAARQGYNLLLAGHTHGGQVTVEILDESINPARFFTPFVYGVYRSGGSAAYVTRGIGTIGLPARIGAPPEIALVRLRKA